MDYYSILNVTKSASPEEIKAAYRKLAMKHHPDRGGDESEFQKIQEAYNVLSDPEKRSEYDNPQTFSHNFSGFHQDINDFFRHFNINFGPRPAPRKNRNLQLAVQMSLLDILNGKEIITNLTLPSGNSSPIQIKIPKGISHGMHIRYEGLGDDSVPNLPKGDLIIVIEEIRDEKFKRHNNGADLYTELPVCVFTALVGGKVSLKNFDGSSLEIKIPQGIHSGATLACAGKGLPVLNSDQRGMLMVKVQIKIPKINDHSDIQTIEKLKEKYESL